jgi:hypothetical protein
VFSPGGVEISIILMSLKSAQSPLGSDEKGYLLTSLSDEQSLQSSLTILSLVVNFLWKQYKVLNQYYLNVFVLSIKNRSI